jgi:bifunctional non-homologous end joining protein LigD
MLARSGALPVGDYAYEVKWDGFRAIVGRNGGYRVRSRRGWDMAALLPELADLPPRVVLDGELVAFADGRPYFPLVCERLLHGDRSIPLLFVAFDVLEVDGEPIVGQPYRERRAILEALPLGSGPWCVAPVLDGGEALFAAVCRQGLEGVVAKRRGTLYRPGQRGWIKVKNRAYWRYGQELEAAHRRWRRG